jgi:DNA-directed RNA polymerase subunit K/omega
MDTNPPLDPEPVSAEEPAAPAPRPLAQPIESRFLFVDVAAMRAKQLRRGALARLEDEHIASMRVIPHKPERVAMEEVRRNLVLYETPPPKKAPSES